MPKFIRILSVCLLLMVLVSGITFIYLRESSLRIYNASLLSAPSSVKIYYDNGELMEQSPIATTDQIPDHVKNAFVSIEDKRFYNHKGIDYKRVAGAAIDNIKAGRKKEGGSTISQQIIKNTHLTNKKTYTRKIKEFFLAQRLERDFSKDEILTMYLNTVYFGGNVYGIENAAQSFFSKSARELSLEEGALLAAIINSPSSYSPTEHQDKALKRRNMVLRTMQENGYISKEQLEQAVKTDIRLRTSEQKKHSTKVLESVILSECQGLSSEPNLQIYTSINKEKQSTVTEALSTKNTKIANAKGKMPDYQAVIINNSSGLIEAYQSNSAKAYFANRQPASAIKPILVYAPALEKNIISPATIITDTEIDFNGYSPKNHDNKYHGAVTARQCLAQSLNVPTVKLLSTVGIDNAKSFAKRAGVVFDKRDTGYAIGLGGFNKGITVVQTANTFQAIASGGEYVKSGLITKIVSNNKIIYERRAKPERIMREDTAFLVTDMLKTAAKSGTSYRLKDLPFDVAAKTGTAGSAKGNTDAYSVVYTSEHTIGIWQGELNGGTMNARVCGSTTPTKISKDILERIYKAAPEPFKMPNSVRRIRLDKTALENGRILQADGKSRSIETEIFSKYNLPKIIKRQELAPIELPIPQKTTVDKPTIYQTIKKLLKPIRYKR